MVELDAFKGEEMVTAGCFKQELKNIQFLKLCACVIARRQYAYIIKMYAHVILI